MREWRPATSSTRPRASSPPHPSTASSSARRPTTRRIARSPTGRSSRSWPRARPGRFPRGRRSRPAPASGSTSCSGRRRRSSAAGPRCDLLLDALRRCRAERAVQLVTLVGVPGIGKSRLVWELFAGGRARAGLRHVAPGPVAAVRRRRHLLGAGRDDQRPVRASSTPTPPTRRRPSSARPWRT